MSSLAVQLYTLRDQTDLRDTLQRLAGLGYQAVEPFNPLDDPAGFRALLDETGLEVRSTHAPLLGDQREDVAKALETLGLTTVIVPFIAPDDFADLSRTADTLNEVAAWGAKHGFSVGYHNHHWELELVDGRHALEVLADQLDPAVFLEVDVYWAAVGGADVPALLRRLGERVRFLHVKDGPGTVTEAMTAVGSGTLDIPAILAAAPDAMRIVELDRCDTDMWQAVADSLTYLRGVGA